MHCLGVDLGGVVIEIDKGLDGVHDEHRGLKAD